MCIRDRTKEDPVRKEGLNSISFGEESTTNTIQNFTETKQLTSAEAISHPIMRRKICRKLCSSICEVYGFERDLCAQLALGIERRVRQACSDMGSQYKSIVKNVFSLIKNKYIDSDTLKRSQLNMDRLYEEYFSRMDLQLAASPTNEAKSRTISDDIHGLDCNLDEDVGKKRTSGLEVESSLQRECSMQLESFEEKLT
eukprot:TRINITY_DN11420_c0_g1_i2.p1 TRINITY_DN11420_c0_g1~~TRINITY_DN11420_c0_g1_i2.p1  ORF type:complete len:218 (-),score=39.48 TRINITY_DN11420_c0_g1_i2:164-757(-)